jgi:DNA-binding CsgD family transcriptional regulator
LIFTIRDNMNAEQLKIIATHTPREAATILGVHIRTVRYHKQRIEGKSAQLKEPKTGYKKWTQEEDDYLLTFGNHSTYPELQEVFKVSRTQIDHRCKILGVFPKKLKQRKTLTEQEKEVCLQGCTGEVAKKLGLSVSTVRRRTRELLRADYRLFDSRTSVPLPSTPTKSLINFVSYKQPLEPTLTPGNDVLKEEKNKIGINEILSQFQGLSGGQIHQMELIYSYCPESAVRYCEVIREYAKNKTPYLPATIRNDR